MLEDSISEVERIDGRRVVARERQEVTRAVLVLEGHVCRYIDDRRGLRQIVAVHLPGDFVDLHGYPLRTLDHNVATLTPALLAHIPHAALDRIVAAHPQLGVKLWFQTMADAAMHRRWTFRLGRMKSLARVAHFLAETYARMYAINRADGTSYPLPLTQSDIGEVCGLTSVHINRVLRELRAREICTVRAGMVEITNLPELVKLGQFDPTIFISTPILTRIFACAGKSPRRQHAQYRYSP